jgi:4-amino-4-deoxy-L-arabinose transferase-like glycosyltransferase
MAETGAEAGRHEPVIQAPEPRASSSYAFEPARLSDALWIALAIALLIGTGFGMRAPWPADEPRFALIAREMVHTGEWLFPRIGGDLYPDKPPVYFWLLSIGYFLTGSLRASFLIPAFVAACTVAGLVYDIGRRMAGRASGLAAALTLSCCIQFVMTMRGAQIDPVLCALTTLSLYGFLRHLLFGPAWGWYFVGGVAAGLGVVTKGVGFLPLLVLIPYAVLRARGFKMAPPREGAYDANWVAGAGVEPAAARFSRWRWGLVAVGFLLGVSVWIVPMLVAVATRGDPALAAYRDEILFQQTVHRYASAWHHVKPWYYFIVEVIPGLWLPLSLLFFWLVPRWAAAWRERDGRVWVPLGWVLLTLLFFSLSAGKRGIYIFPALPALAIAAAPYLPDIFRRRGVQRASLILGALLVTGGIALLIAEASGHQKLHAKLAEQGIDSVAPFAIFVGLGIAAWALTLWKKPVAAWPVLLAGVAMLWSYGITPAIDGERSARDFMKQTLALVPGDTDLGLLEYKEQFLLYLDRPIVNFGHARWREGEQEAYDASVWLSERPGRVLLIPESAVSPCFVSTTKQLAGLSSGDRWFLVKGPVTRTCVAKGDGSRAIRYDPPVYAGS